ncbi:MAG: SGNH/GDSL hydrolase family protein [Candidatus Binatia bacterium]
MARVRAWLQRLALMALGVVLGVVILEGALQVGAIALWATGRPTPTAWAGVRRRVLCLGDSNTYGLWIPDRADAYPQQLERLWNGVPERGAIEVMNLGYPGTNSSKLLHNLPGMLETLRPDLVIIMVGANDEWTVPVPIAGGGMPGRVGQLVQRHSRVYQLIHMLQRAFDHRQLEVDYPVHNSGSVGTARFGAAEFSLGWTRGRNIRGAETWVDLSANLNQVVDIIRSFGAEPVFLTYGSVVSNYGQASRVMRNVAAHRGVRLIDAAAPVAAVCPKEPCPEWLYRDHHLTAAGYRVMAEKVVQELGDARVASDDPR